MKRVLFISLFLLICAKERDLVASEPEVDVTIHKVGQGNCISVRLFNPSFMKEPEHVLFDAGSSAYIQEWIYHERRPLPPAASPSSPKGKGKEETPRTAPPSTIKPSNFSTIVAQQKETVTRYSFFDSLRLMLSNKSDLEDEEKKEELKEPIKVRAVVITHPDKDHYGWLTQVFRHKRDVIQTLVFGGLPHHYDMSGQMKLKKWLKRRLQTDSTLYFPAISWEPIKDVQQLDYPGEWTYAPHRYDQPGSPERLFGDAFQFGAPIKLSFLSVNPTHWGGNKDVILRSCFPDDDNSDSLVVKIANGHSSIILTGDATSITTNRILNNYIDQPDFLKATWLLGSHHGSSTHGSNEPTFLKAVDPEGIALSNGHFQGHPDAAMYENTRVCKRLMIAPPHNVLVGEVKTKQRKKKQKEDEVKGTLHTTYRAIFSTLTNGTLQISLKQNGTTQVKTEKEGIIELTSPAPAPADTVVEVISTETSSGVITTPLKGKEETSERPSKRSKPSAGYPLSGDEGDD